MDRLSQRWRTQAQPTLNRGWWFVSFVCPLACAAFAPLANLFGILSFCEPWVVANAPTVEAIHRPKWNIAVNAISLASAVIANVLLLMNFARRIRYMLGTPITITLWYISAILQTTTFGLTSARHNKDETLYTQAYYYAVIACTMHFVNATLLLSSLLPTLRFPIFRNTFPVYQPHMLLYAPQRTLMLQSLIFTLYLGLGGGIFSSIEGWTYLDAIYWTNYSILTIGFGSDFTPTKLASKIVLVPYTAGGIFVIGLVVGSIHTLFVARFRERIVWGKEVVHHQRRKWWRTTTIEDQGGDKKKKMRKIPHAVTFWYPKVWRTGDSEIPLQGPKMQAPLKWSKDEWEIMRHLKRRVDTQRRYLSLLATFTLFFVIWFGGALLFWIIERDVEEQAGKLTYPLSLYFTYVSLLTIGYGDVIPKSRAGRPFFVVWSLAAIPSMTLLISDIGDTFAKWVKEGPIESVIGRWLIGNVEEEQGDTLSLRENEEEEEGEKEEKRRVSVIGEKVRLRYSRKPEEEEERTCVDEVQKALILLQQVRKVIRDDEHKQYTWEEWQKWIRLLELDKDRGYENGDVSRWTWLGDDGPMSAPGESEKLWLLEKFRQKLDEKMESLLD